MRPYRAVGKVLLVATFFALCFVLLADAIGWQSPWLGLLLMFYFMGLAQVAEPLVRLRMPRALRAVAPRSADAKPSRRLGVRRFGAVLRRTPLRRLNRSVYLGNSRRHLATTRDRIESSEAIHFWAAILFTPYIVHVALRGLVGHALLFVVVQVLFNVYPILHLRMVRGRLARVVRTPRAPLP